MEDRSKRAETVRPQHDEHCERQFMCDSASSAKSEKTDIVRPMTKTWRTERFDCASEKHW